MDTTYLVTIITLLIGLSMASERLVEIIKGLVPVLDQQRADRVEEGRRRAALQALAVVASIGTALLASPVLPDVLRAATGTWGILALGLLASGGSGLWNAVLTYFGKVKDIKSLDLADRQLERGEGPSFRDLSLGSEQVTSNECYDVGLD